MILLKQSTARTATFFAHDVNGDGVTGIADGSWTKRISKDGGAFAAMTVTITEMENGWYSFPLSTAHTDTIGFLSISFSSASSKRVNMLFDVRPRLLDDLCFPTVSGRSIDVDATGGVEVGSIVAGAITAAAIATDAIDADAIADNAIDAAAIATGAITAAKFAAGAVDAAALAADAVAEIADGVWDELKAGHTVADSFGDYLDIEVSSRLAPAVAGRTLAVSAAGEADANVQKWRGDSPASLDVATGRIFSISTLVGSAAWDSLSAHGATLTADSGTTTTIVDAVLTEAATDYWKGSLVVFKTGANSFLARLVTAFDPTTDTLTLAPALPTGVSGGDTYWLVPHGAVDIALWRASVPNTLLSGRVDANVQAMANDVLTAAAIATGAIDADALAAGAITSAKFAADAIDSVAFAASAAAEIADKLLGRGIQGGADGGRTVTDALRYLRNRVAISGGTMTVYQENDSTTGWTAAVTTAAGNPITEIDPA